MVDSTERADKESDELKKYEDVITDEATSDAGLFTVHRVDEKLYFEIPDSTLDKEMLLVSRIARTHADLGYGGQKANTQVVRWQRQDDTILLRVVTYESVASPEHPIYEAVRNAKFEPIIDSFEIAARNDDSTASVIDVSELYTTDVELLGMQKSSREEYKVKSLDADRTFINWAKSFPQNIEVRHTLTYNAAEPPSNPSTSTISLEMNQSMVMLPSEPMTARACDDRVGYFNVEMVDYSLDAQKAKEKCYITRWRLEPKDREAFDRGELVEPEKPIVYYIDPSTPEKWRPYIKQGVEDWQVAFENAGFKNAIIAKDPPTEAEDPEFSPEDVRYSVIRYFPSDVQNAYGPHVHDPRTGEILESDIGWYHNVMNLLRNWYFIQTSAANPQARHVEFSDEMMGELIRFVAAHEVGHTLGLPHNWGSSHAYPVDSLRSPTFTSTHGTAPSIMDYARFNYVAQPGDGVTNFMPAIGKYDKWAIKWGYQVLPDEANSSDDVEAILNEWIVERADDPAYFYGRQTGNRIDPRSQNEDLGNNAVAASEYGLANLKRIIPELVDWTYQEGESYEELDELYDQVITQWQRYLGHVARYVGGVYETDKTYDQEGFVYETVPESTQVSSMAFLNEHGFQTPTWLMEEEIIRRIEHAGALERIRSTQASVLDLLLDAQRIARLIEAEARQEETYSPSEMLSDLRSGIWSELEDGRQIDTFRRNLQRAYLEKIGGLMTTEVETPPAAFREYMGFTPVDVSQSDIHAYVRGELETVRDDVQAALDEGTDPTTRLHLRDVIARIDNILNPDDD